MEEKNLVDKAILKEWHNAIYNSQNGYSQSVSDFKDRYPEEYKLFTAMYRKRVGIKECLTIMEDIEEPIYWFTLTFNNDKDVNTIKTKRRDAQLFLNRISICYLMVEEYGEDNGRYHIHGFLCFKYGCGFLDFKEWHSRQKIELIEGVKIKKKIKYLTDYCVKSVPRLRRSKNMAIMCAYYKKHKGMKKCFPSTYLKDFKSYVDKVVNPFYNNSVQLA